jgi:ADP-ribose pyrophosphatase
VIWEFITRKSVQGVDIIARCQGKILVNIEKRYPVDAFVLGFPGGICDDHDVLAQAVKELKEETGFQAENIENLKLQPLVWIDPWKSREKTQYVDVVVNENFEGAHQELEEFEVITNKFVDAENLSEELRKVADDGGFKFDARLYSYAFGREIGKRIARK